MTEPHMDENDLARFLDGRMPDEERGGAVAHLSASDADAELLADAAYLLRDLEGEEGAVVHDASGAAHPHDDEADTGHDSRVVPLRPPSTARTWRRGPVRWLALAAVLAGVVLAPLALSRSGGRDAGDFAALLSSRQAGLPTADWLDRERWRRARGEGGLTADLPLSARLGALQVDLEVAAAAGQAEQTRLSADRIAALVDAAPGSAAVAAAYRDIARRAQEPAETLAPAVAEAREHLAMLVDEDHFSLGAWTEAATIAVQRRDAGFFHARASGKMLNRAAKLPSLDAEARATVQAVRAAAGANPPDWTALASRTDELLRKIAG